MSKEVGITVSKNEDFSEWYTQIIIKAELADYAPVKGLIVLRPDGYSIWESIKESLDKKLKETGHRNGFLPILIPESLLEKEKELINMKINTLIILNKIFLVGVHIHQFYKKQS